IEGAGITVVNAEVDNIPENRVAVDEGKAESVLKMLSTLEDLDDVQNVYANYDIDDDVLERLGA
ncbi:MAG: YebC/PmpR family DNA-binding transcriptional regulator, partial [Myxococcota bacterium]